MKVLKGACVVGLMAFGLLYGVRHLWATSEHLLLYVPDPLRSQIAVIDLAADRILGSLPTRQVSRNVLLDADHGYLYIANTGWVTRSADEPGTVSILRVPSKISEDIDSAMGAIVDSTTELALVTAGISPKGLALNESRDTLFVANAGDGSVSVVGVPEGKLLDTYHPDCDMPSSVAVKAGTGLLFVSCQGSDTIVILAPDGSAKARVPVGRSPSDVLVTSDGTRVLVANSEDNSVTVLDAASFKLVATIPVGDNPIRLAAGSDGIVYVANLFSASIMAIDPFNAKVSGGVELGDGMGALEVSPRGEPYALAFKHGDIFHCNDGATSLTSVIRTAHLPAVGINQVGF